MRLEAEARAQAPGREDGDGEGGGAQVTVLPDAVRLQARDGETVLRAALRSGFRYRWGCKRGGCGVCKVRLIVGEVYYERPIAASVLTGTERAAGVCLSCRAVPITDIVIQLQEGDRLQGGGLRGGNSAGG
jgi:ferredoxin